LCALCFLCAGIARAADGRDVVVLVNTASPHSVEIGAHYAKLRNVPDKNICRITCTTSESMSRKSFDTKIREPLRAWLVKKGLAEKKPDGVLSLKVAYLVSTYGVPLKVREDYANVPLKELPRDPLKVTAAAVDSELSLIALPKHRLDGSLANPLYRNAKAKTGAVLFTARLDGPTPEIARGLVDAAIKTEADGLAGIAYIDALGLTKGTYKLGDKWLLAVGGILKKAGFFTRVDRAAATFHADVPMPHAAFYFGWYSATVSGPMARDDFRFAPGAIAYHLHSASAARVRTTRIGWVGPLLDKGAAVTMGAVFEPYLDGTVDTGEFTRLLLAGKTFAESAHRATPKTSWMMTFIGDPLYAPFRAGRRDAAMAGGPFWRDVHEADLVTEQDVTPHSAPFRYYPPFRAGRRDAAMAGGPFWRDVHEAVLATEKGDIARALAACAKHGSKPIFVELAALAQSRAGNADAARKLWLKLAGLVKDDYSAVLAHGHVGDSFVASGKPKLAMEAYIRGAAARPQSPHTLPLYRKGLRLARSLKKSEQEAGLWLALADNFPSEPIGRFAAGELWARGLRTKCSQPTLPVTLVANAPVIDGQPGDPAWKKAAGIDVFLYCGGPQVVVPRIRARLVRDATALYLLAEMHGATGGGPAARDESFEIMLAPERDAIRASRIAIPRRGRAVTSLKGITWRRRELFVKSGRRMRSIGWLIEMKIPFAALGAEPPATGSIWAANFVERNSVPQFPFQIIPSFRSWAMCGDDPLAADCGGYLIFK